MKMTASYMYVVYSPGTDSCYITLVVVPGENNIYSPSYMYILWNVRVQASKCLLKNKQTNKQTNLWSVQTFNINWIRSSPANWQVQGWWNISQWGGGGLNSDYTWGVSGLKRL